MNDPIVDELLTALPGATHLPGSDIYGVATSPDNKAFDQNPCAVVSVRSATDVAQAVKIAARTGTRIVVQATGHGVGGPVEPTEILIDVSALRSVALDPATRTVGVGAGATWPAVQAAAAPHHLLGLAGTSPTVGVAGYTFTGGVGWLVRKHGLASAALESVDFVDGTGQQRRAARDAADARDRAALWAFRGGGPVGIATAITISLVPVPQLWTGYLLWPADALAPVAAAWANTTRSAKPALTSTLSMLRLPPDGPFPESIRETAAVHLSYASPDGAGPLEAMRDAVRNAAAPAVDTTGPGDLQTLTQIHLDPPSAVAARGSGRWVLRASAEEITAIFSAARIGQPGGLNMIELRHTDSAATEPDGALVKVPAPFLLHAVGDGDDDATRARTDSILAHVERAAHSIDVGKAAPAFREGQPTAGDALTNTDAQRLRSIRDSFDPHRILAFHRHAAE